MAVPRTTRSAATLVAAGAVLGAAAAVLALKASRTPDRPAVQGIPRPPWHFLALVAGQGSAGFADGSPGRARFAGPVALAVSPDGERLAVADRENQRVRLVQLNGDGGVSTVAGGVAAGLSLPNAVAFLTNDTLAVNDEGNALVRQVDLRSGVLSTLAGSGERGALDGEAPKAALGEIFSIAFHEKEKALYLSQPNAGALRRLDLTARVVRTVLRDDPRIPHPGALAIHEGALIVADRDGAVWRLGPSPDPEAKAEEVPLEPLGSLARVAALASSGGALYALEARSDTPLVRVLPSPPEPVTLLSVHGEEQDSRKNALGPHLVVGSEFPAGLAGSKRADRELFVSSTELASILAVKDYDFARHRDAALEREGDVTDYGYPTRKPAGVFRLLTIGDSHLFYETAKEQRRWGTFNRIETTPKRLELFLNTWSALDGRTARYEVLTLGKGSSHPLFVWPVYDAPSLARRYDVDLVVLVVPPDDATLNAYLDRPATEEGLPASSLDPEHLLLPVSEKVKRSPARSLFEKAAARGLFHAVTETQGEFTASMGVLAGMPELHGDLLDLMARPLAALRLALDAAPGEKSRPIRLVLTFAPYGRRGSSEAAAAFLSEVAGRAGVPYVNLAEDIDVLRETYYPISEMDSLDHSHAGGHALLGFLLARRLVKSGLVPF